MQSFRFLKQVSGLPVARGEMRKLTAKGYKGTLRMTEMFQSMIVVVG